MIKHATLALALLLVAPAMVQGQDTPVLTESEQWFLNRTQLVESLASPIEAIRTQSLKNAIVFATLYRDKVDLSSAVKAIETVYENDSQTVNRKLALAALQAIGTSRATRYLVTASPATTNEGRALVASVLNDYYLARPGSAVGLEGSY